MFPLCFLLKNKSLKLLCQIKCLACVAGAGDWKFSNHFQGAGTGGHFRGAGTGESEAPSGLDGTSRDDGERAFRTPAQSPSQSNPPPCPAVPEVESAHPQPRCRGLHSTPHSHSPRRHTWDRIKQSTRGKN